MNKPKKILLIDGECVLCNGLAKWLIPRIRKGPVGMGSLQDTGLLKSLSLSDQNDLSTLIFIDEKGVHYKSSGVLRLFKLLSFPYPILASVFFIVPRFLRDPIYNWVAKNRIKWFGRQDSCDLGLQQEHPDRFVWIRGQLD